MATTLVEGYSPSAIICALLHESYGLADILSDAATACLNRFAARWSGIRFRK